VESNVSAWQTALYRPKTALQLQLQEQWPNLFVCPYSSKGNRAEKTTIARAFHENMHYGFICRTEPGCLGVEGRDEMIE
jgi:hypothetical protein